MWPSATALAITLGPTNPWLIVIAKETLVFRRPLFSSGLWLLVPTFVLPDAPTEPRGRSSQRSRILSYQSALRRNPQRRYYALAPIICGAKSLDE